MPDTKKAKAHSGFYFIRVFGGVEARIAGPYMKSDSRGRRATQMATMNPNDTILALDLVPGEPPSVHVIYGGDE